MGAIQDRVQISKGSVPRFGGVNKYGVNPGIDAGPESLWQAGGLIVYPAAAAVPQIVSSDANDTALGTGAQQVRIEGLDANWRPITVFVELDGLTPVVLDESWIRVNRCRVVRAGTVKTNAGILTITIGATLVVHMAVGTSSTQKSQFTVGVDQIAYVMGVSASVRRPAQIAGAQATFELQATNLIDTPNPVRFVGAEMSLVIEGASAIERNFVIPLRVQGPADVEFVVTEVSDASTRCTGFISYVIEDLVLAN